jgi:hypothetical protein
MPRVGLEPTTPVFKRAKTVHAFDRAATVIGNNPAYFPNVHKHERMKMQDIKFLLSKDALLWDLRHEGWELLRSILP